MWRSPSAENTGKTMDILKISQREKIRDRQRLQEDELKSI